MYFSRKYKNICNLGFFGTFHVFWKFPLNIEFSKVWCFQARLLMYFDKFYMCSTIFNSRYFPSYRDFRQIHSFGVIFIF